MLKTFLLYFNTIKHLKPSQLYYRIIRRLGIKIILFINPFSNNFLLNNFIGLGKHRNFRNIENLVNTDNLGNYVIPEVDLSSSYISRFNIDELMNDTFTFLNIKKKISVSKDWNDENLPRLWIFNLHYFEYVFALAQAHKKNKAKMTGDKIEFYSQSRYYIKFKDLVLNWIKVNKREYKNAWDPYTVSVRLVNWILSFELFYDEISLDTEFGNIYTKSIYSHYLHLQKMKEKDILGNHYIENLKALILGSLFFAKEDKLMNYYDEWEAQLKEQILDDGIHFELSPMYHKIVLEAIIKVSYWLLNYNSNSSNNLSFNSNSINDTNSENAINSINTSNNSNNLRYSNGLKDLNNLRYSNGLNHPEKIISERINKDIKNIEKMISGIYSLEKDMGKMPFFNDCAEDIAKGTEALLLASEKYFKIKCRLNSELSSSGYYILQNGDKKCVIDAGIIGPKYQPGHGHCDALSYELSLGGKPLIVNSGTYEYERGHWRNFFRSTRAHNTVIINDTEQAQCWGSFRVGDRIKKVEGNIIESMGKRYFVGEYTNLGGELHNRKITWIDDNTLLVLDRVEITKPIKLHNKNQINNTINAKSYIHIHPDFKLEKTEDDGIWKVIRCGDAGEDVATIMSIGCDLHRIYYGEEENGWYSPSFGAKLKNYVLELQAMKALHKDESQTKFDFGYIMILNINK